jgi:exodeoxyribonuclease X
MGAHPVNHPKNEAWTRVRFAVVDVEGNGQQPPDLVEVAIVPVVGGVVGTPESWLVRPPRPITPMARHFHKISNDDVAGHPHVEEVAEQIRGRLDHAVFVAHNAHVDLAVLIRELPGFTPFFGVVDTLKLARRLLPGRASYKLSALAADLELTRELSDDLRPHRAAYDALVCTRLLFHLAALPKPTPPSLGDLLTTPPTTPEGNGDAPSALF